MSYELPSRRLISQEDQAMIQRPDVPRSRFTGSWTRKTTFDAGYLVPFMVDEVLPGDHLKYDVTAYVRMATPLFPIMDNQRIDTFFFFVPNRIVWSNWKRFMGEQPLGPTQTIDLTIPKLDSSPSGGFLVGSIFDHFGLPVQGMVGSNVVTGINVLPLRAYNAIYNEWFRDENLVDAAAIATGDGPDTTTFYSLRRRAKSHDYFTSALPWPQKFTAPNVPVGGLAPVLGIGFNQAVAGSDTSSLTIKETGNPANVQYTSGRYTTTVQSVVVEATGTAANASPLVYANLEEATGVSINTLRQSFLVQQLLERDARGGTRYTEIVKSHFGVTSPDQRMQRPEYIGGGSSPFQITPVAQTAPTEGITVGALGAAGTAVGSHRASYAATEHGYIIGLINVKTELSYSQGLHKMWNRNTRYDFYWPSLAGLGEQAVLRRELYITASADDDIVFGYQERWHEYRTRTSEVTGLFRPQVTGAIDQWHLSQEFGSAPVLGQTFIEDTPPMSRVLAAGDTAVGQQYLADILVRREAVRPIPMYGTPVTLGRF